VFVEVEGDAVEGLRARVEAVIAERIRREYRVEPCLELEFELFFDRLLLPRVRGGRGGSKKRYAGWSEGRLVLVGLESVRRDWPAVARRLQEGMLERLFTDRPVEPFVRELVERVERGELDAELVYAKRVRKGSLDRYTETTPPHVAAARKLAALGRRPGMLVRYVVTRDGPEPVLPGAELPGGIDRRHYVERVLRPIGESILAELGSSFGAAIGRPQPAQLELL
jgi:DNA polymerase-2